jgi:hypothetical protein
MHEFSEVTKRVLDTGTWLFFIMAGALTLDRVAAIVTIISGLIGIACGSVRLLEYRHRSRAARAD